MAVAKVKHNRYWKHQKNEFREAIEALEMIEATSSKNEKVAILTDNKHNSKLEEIFMYTFNPQWIYGIKKLDDLDLEGAGGNLGALESWNRMKELMDRLAAREVTGNKAITEATVLLSHAPKAVRKWLVRILFRELQAGLQLSTVHKALGKFVPEYRVLLASKDPKKIVYPCYIEPKLDGMRCNIYVHEDGRVTMCSRNGTPFEGFNDIEEVMSKMPKGKMYDGELLGKDGNFKGIQKLAMKQSEGKEAMFIIYDYTPIWFMERTDTEILNISFKTRRKKLKAMKLPANKGIVRLGKSYLVSSREEAMTKYQQFLDEGFEGAICKLTDMKYEKNTESKRSKGMIKMKPFETIDLEIIGFEEERDVNKKKKGTLGNIKVDYKGHVLSVGSGLKRKDHPFTRDEIWNNQNKYLGRIAEIEYDAESSNQKGGLSLRFPRFKTIRMDK